MKLASTMIDRAATYKYQPVLLHTNKSSVSDIIEPQIIR